MPVLGAPLQISSNHEFAQELFERLPGSGDVNACAWRASADQTFCGPVNQVSRAVTKNGRGPVTDAWHI